MEEENMQPAAAQPRVVDPETSRAIDDAVKAGRIVFEPGWNAQPPGDAREAVVNMGLPREKMYVPAQASEPSAEPVAYQVRHILPDGSPDYRAGLAQWTPCTKDEYELWKGEPGLAVRALCVAAPARAVEPLTNQEVIEAVSVVPTHDSAADQLFESAQTIIDAFCRKNGIGIPATTPTQAAQENKS